VYQPENRAPDSFSLKCFNSLSRGANPEVACDTFEQSDKVELDLDMVEEGGGGHLSVSELLEFIIFLPKTGVERGVVSLEMSESESDSLELVRDETWSEAERKEKELLDGLVTFLLLKVRGEFV